MTGEGGEGTIRRPPIETLRLPYSRRDEDPNAAPGEPLRDIFEGLA